MQTFEEKGPYRITLKREFSAQVKKSRLLRRMHAAREIITRMSHSNSDADALLLYTLARGKRKHGDDKGSFAKHRSYSQDILHKAMLDCPILKVWHG